MGSYMRLLFFLKDLKKEVTIKILIGLGIIAMSFLQAFMIARGITSAFNEDSMKTVMLYLSVCLVAILIRAFLLRYQEGYAKQMAAKVKTKIRNMILDKIIDLGPGYLNEVKSGNIQSLLTDGVEAFEVFLVSYIPQIAIVFLSVLASVVYLSILDVYVGLLVILMTILSIVVPHFFMPAVSKLMITYWRKYADLNAAYVDSMQGMETLKAFHASKRIGKQMAKDAKDFSEESIKNTGMSLADSAAIILFISIGTSMSVALSVYHTAVGEISYASLLIILFLIGECMKPLADLNTYWHGSYLGFSVAEQLYELMDQSTALTEESGDITEGINEKPMIQIHDLDFRYKKDLKLVLNKVHIKIDGGKTVAIVGKSGSGKSTLVNLLLRFYDLSEGTILINGKNIKEYSLEYLREKIAVVFQDTYLFYGTVAENLKMSNEKASMDEVINAAKAANAHEFIMDLPNGYDTIVGERGATLSGGERQRISIARAILKNAPILILDEATSSVDIKNEELIQSALENLTKNRTTIIIAHRFSTIEHADEIVVMEQGKVVESGTHFELIQNNGTYKQLVQAQEAG
ncbi:ABC transporter ATP-binding protein [Sinanaerobacter sp. ZZT-01]|uniref:ABC transporter ATP-binding protein n=1 Tax=Sinanaerobacter sp. ZZT-01 TaxID=3111540 RepID=UPI002D7832AE|nr:ABC transporter ATP-binding protein [Sinanaerobacter sp. ZZT-01]WRR93023.1 ABC transporter ATP-binding protein [Sinanaerobacter sp. ZZT-01]